jgi:hypothetical protein
MNENSQGTEPPEVAAVLPEDGSSDSYIAGRAINASEAAELRWRLGAIADDWDRPEMDVYDSDPDSPSASCEAESNVQFPDDQSESEPPGSKRWHWEESRARKDSLQGTVSEELFRQRRGD